MPNPPNIKNSIAGADLHVIELTDPDTIKLYAIQIAKQMNTYRMGFAPQKRVRDLHDWIADIIIETTAQGASLLEVHIIDPAWTLFIRDKNGVSYIDVDDSGFLWPPIEVTFPQDISDCTWRLCQCRPSSDLNQANVVLTFEDKIVSELRGQYKQQVSFPDQTRAEFIQSLVQQANSNRDLPTDVDIRFVPLLPHSTFTTADLTLSQRIPTSATQGSAPTARKNPGKAPPVSPSTFRQIETAQAEIHAAVQGVDISIQNGWDAFTSGSFLNGFVPIAQRPSRIDALPPPSFLGG